jgi:hypothetical protein
MLGGLRRAGHSHWELGARAPGGRIGKARSMAFVHNGEWAIGNDLRNLSHDLREHPQ